MNKDFVEMLGALSAERARFLIVGAHALAAHGVVRATGDLDIFVEPTAVNAKRVYRALVKFRAPLFDLTEADLARKDIVFQMGNPPYRIDILTGITGVSFAQAWKDRVRQRVGGLTVAFLGRKSLLRNKASTGRLKDAADVEALRALPRARR